MSLYAVFALFAAAAMLLFARLPPRTAILVTFLGGWLILPVGDLPPAAPNGGLPWWIIGLALPSDMLVTKAWDAAGVALLGGVLFDPARVRAWRPGWFDLPMACWCFWPLVDGLFVSAPAPSPIVGFLYVTGSWGLPWLLGRLWFDQAEARTALLVAQVWAGIALLPIALIEGVLSPILYDALYGPHPFRTDGMDRYVGYRPLGFFENGNQYDIWICVSAFAAIWLAFCPKTSASPLRPIWLWLPVTVAAAAAQSVGAFLLVAAGLAFLALRRQRFVMPLMIGGAALVTMIAAVHLSGAIPLQRIARDTPVGRQILDAVRATGRGSLTWRISQDTKVLPAIHAAPLQGTDRWDWFRPFGARPWGLAMLLIGQFGLVGFLLAYGSTVGPAIAAVLRSIADTAWASDDATLPLAMMVLLAMADAALNAFIYLPAILIAGAIAVRFSNAASERLPR